MNLSKEKIEKISEQILAFLYSRSPLPLFTYHIAREIARDEEFVKRILNDLRSKGLIIEIKKNPEGVNYLKRSRWQLSDATYVSYKKHQH